MNYHDNFKLFYRFRCKLLVGLLAFWSSCWLNANEAIKVEIVKSNSGYQLLRGGKAYTVKGAGLEFKHFDSLVAHGGNSIRTWSTTSNPVPTEELLDKAFANGMTVSLCLDMAAERWGFDYNDKDMVAAQLERVRAEVIKYRNHPALLSWIIGNELNHSYTNPKVYDAVNDISKLIHQLDPNHPTTTTLAGIDEMVLNQVKARASDLDFISFQVYGQLAILPDFIKKTGYSKPFMVTEWGAIGYWEMEKTTWGAPLEMNSSDKARNYLNGYQHKLKPLEKQLLGSYTFFWGQKQERTPTWFGLFTETGEATQAVDVMHYIWNGSWPANRSPEIRTLVLDAKTASQSVMLKAGKTYSASIDAFDHEADILSYSWQIKPESQATQEGGDYEKNIQNLSGLMEKPSAKQIKIKAPVNQGAYRLFVYVFDEQGHAAHANIPFYIKD